MTCNKNDECNKLINEIRTKFHLETLSALEIVILALLDYIHDYNSKLERFKNCKEERTI